MFVMSSQIWVYLLIGALGTERLIEMAIARRNRRWQLMQGAGEYGQSFSRWLFLFHGLWFLSFFMEATLTNSRLLVHPGWAVAAFLILQGVRYWCIVSLGYFWNTKIIVLPGAPHVRKGPYRWLEHPNYLVVRIELFLYPALCGCWITALFCGVANLVMVRKRIGQEQRALRLGKAPGHPVPD